MQVFLYSKMQCRDVYKDKDTVKPVAVLWIWHKSVYFIDCRDFFIYEYFNTVLITDLLLWPKPFSEVPKNASMH